MDRTELANILGINVNNIGYEKKINKWNVLIHNNINIKIPQELVKDGSLIIEFHTYLGNFDCSNLGLTTLKGVPDVLVGSFDCSNNNITDTDFEYVPIINNGYFICNNNKIKELNNLPVLNNVNMYENIKFAYYFENCEIDEINFDRTYRERIYLKGSKILKINDDNKQDLNLYKALYNYFKKFNYEYN